MEKTAVVQSGGKQYVVQEGETLLVEKLGGKPGEKIQFEEVLLASDGKKVSIGTPLVDGARVESEIIEQGKSKKVFGVKMKAKKRHKKYFGHRQPYTKVKITKIS